MKYLIRCISTNFRDRAAIIATEGIDGLWMLKVDEDEIENVVKK